MVPLIRLLGREAHESRSRRPAGLAAFGLLFAFLVLASTTCGGTSGHEGLTLPAPPLALDASTDTSLGASSSNLNDAGLFDVQIFYADRMIPDVSPPGHAAEGGADAGSPWPTCPAFLPVGPDGGFDDSGFEVNQVPAVIDDAGLSAFAPDGSVCAAYGWLGSVTADNCLTSSTSGSGPTTDFALLPPCNWSFSAGTATIGSGAGRPTYTLCLELYQCMMATGCGAGTGPACLCGSASGPDCIVDAGGPCATEELAALQYRRTSVQDALKNYTQIDPSFIGYAGSALNYVFQNARTNSCLLADAGR